MEETITNRIHKFTKFISVYSKLYLSKYIYKSIPSIFSKCKRISSGIEGIVYLTKLTKKKNDKLDQDKLDQDKLDQDKVDDDKLSNKKKDKMDYFDDLLVIKQIDLYKLKKTKTVKSILFDAKPEDIYQLFTKIRVFNYPSLTEIVANTLTNQLILQNICPHYVLNYNWIYDNNKISLYNEYATFGDFHKWCKQKHSYEIWMNALFQITVGLYTIKKYFNMHHTDFHTGNILVHKVKPGGFWIYEINNTKYYLPNLGFIFLLSDFGFAWIPNKLFVEWHYKDKLSYLTKNGIEFKNQRFPSILL